MDDAAPVVIITGADDFRRRRFLAGFMQSMAKTRTITRVEGENIGALVAAMSEADFTGTPVLVVVDNADKVNLGIVEAHHKEGDNTVVLALPYEGTPKSNTKFGKFVKQLKLVHKTHPLPKTWEADDDATDFCVDEAKGRGKKLSKLLAQALVSLTGPDLGLLSFEILKASLLADVRGSDEITSDIIRGVKADVSEAQVFPVVRALENQSVERLIKTLAQVRLLSKDDPVMRVCGVLGSTAQRWLAAANLDAQGVKPKDAANQLVLNPWYYQNKVLPYARRWGQEGAVRLIRVLAASERAVLDGHVDPWTGLVARLVEVCSTA